ncbi:3-dehydroquinate synthase [Staphylococcus auricularis]|uniref:3-dehydroquinate synthase n=1 Tax=Staphylococcus auricularis TaxID=29379 RepID=A0ABX5IE27_9STAP|nr:3-dehydroquinate synthase [Staphylococcus auricularis]MCE5038085.1 3-dehydroquinate synthase [Staphylococcus auricularis]MEB6569395.1 3-dehydroquinate synthase [Staphylococcus auricularis]PTH17625.1 3-dehydroquinate synthase [Staphylococcus auricularis]PTH26844.1 3-dehydroquinate synthase [Staphylococcus auricularis]
MKLETTYTSDNYPIIIEHGALDYVKDKTKAYKHVIFVIDETVSNYWQSKLDPVINHLDGHQLIVPSGEQIKTLEFYTQTIEQLLSLQLTRSTCLVAVGGGATGDFTGFLAATLLRGVDFIQVPTTILAHDSSVGGKVGINSQHGKNLIGAFYRPTAVYYDLDFLNSLSYEQVLSGYAEVYKHALLNGETETQAIEQHFDNQQHLASLRGLDHYLFKGIETKLAIIVQDETEQNQRKYLNLGHTFGHAIEYHYKLPHGHAVAIGIIYQFIVANLMLGTQYDTQHYIDYLNRLGYPVRNVATYDFETILSLMMKDKKNDHYGVQMVLLKGLGEPGVYHVPNHILQQAFEQFTHDLTR